MSLGCHRDPTANKNDQVDCEHGLEQTVASREAEPPPARPPEPAELDMSFDFVTRDAGFKGAADMTQTADSDDGELVNGDVPEEFIHEAHMEPQDVADGVAPTPPKPTDATPPPSPLTGNVAPASDNGKDYGDVDILQQPEAEESVEAEVSALPPRANHRVEVIISGIPLDQQEQYEEVRSNTVEKVNRLDTTEQGQACFHVDFADGREELVSFPVRVCIIFPLGRTIATLFASYDFCPGFQFRLENAQLLPFTICTHRRCPCAVLRILLPCI